MDKMAASAVEEARNVEDDASAKVGETAAACVDYKEVAESRSQL